MPCAGAARSRQGGWTRLAAVCKAQRSETPTRRPRTCFRPQVSVMFERNVGCRRDVRAQHGDGCSSPASQPFVLQRGAESDLQIAGTLTLADAGALSTSALRVRRGSDGGGVAQLRHEGCRRSRRRGARPAGQRTVGLDAARCRVRVSEHEPPRPRARAPVSRGRRHETASEEATRGRPRPDRPDDHRVSRGDEAGARLPGHMRARGAGAAPRAAHGELEGHPVHHGSRGDGCRPHRRSHQLPRRLRHGVSGRRAAEAVRREHLRRRPGRPVRDPRASAR